MAEYTYKIPADKGKLVKKFTRKKGEKVKSWTIYTDSVIVVTDTEHKNLSDYLIEKKE